MASALPALSPRPVRCIRLDQDQTVAFERARAEGELRERSGIDRPRSVNSITP